MNYKYKKGQIFGKRLKVPNQILSKVYNCSLSYSEFIEYGLDDKIPITCLKKEDRQIVEKFGFEKSKQLDWELLNKRVYYSEINFKEILMSLDENNTTLNESLYELVQNEIKPIHYSQGMQVFYANRLFSISESDDDNLNYEKRRFNEGTLSLKDIIYNWDLYQDKDLSYCLFKDSDNKFGIDDTQIKKFMGEFSDIANLMLEITDIYSFINDVNNAQNENERQTVIKNVTDVILDKTLEKNRLNRIELTNNQYRQIFNYSSMEEYLKRETRNTYSVDSIFKELAYLNLPKSYLLDTQIPFTLLKKYDVLVFLETYGVKNIVDFDSECGHFFTKNNCEMLRLMYDMYLNYANNNNDPSTTIFTRKNYDENGNYVDRPYTKDEFYEAMKRMIVNGPSDGNYIDKAPDYRDMTGEFRLRNANLFISESAPAELQTLFYTKSITPQHLVEHPEYISFLNGKDLNSCFKQIQVLVSKGTSYYGYENLYSFISQKTDFNNAMNFIQEYSDVFDIVFDRRMSESSLYEITFSKDESIDIIQRKINDSLKKLIIEKRVAYPKTIPQNLIVNYPSLFLSSDAPKELQEAFYNRTINSDLIMSDLSYRDYLKNVDLEVIYKYMPIKIVRNKSEYGYGYGYSTVNLVKTIKDTFGLEDGFDVMMIYGKYIESAYEANGLQEFKLQSNFSKDDLLDEIDSNILKTIIDGKMKYDENIPTHFKNNNPTLFLGKDVSEDIRRKFYNREFTLNDFDSNPELINILGNTNIVCGFPENVSWMIPLFSNSDNLTKANYNRLKTISEYTKIQDIQLQNVFKEFVIECGNNIDTEKIEYASEVLSRLSLSNSSEIYTFRKELATQILKTPNPIESLNKIEDVFIRNNIPTVGKIYSCFEILHPDFQGFDFNNSMVSPMLKQSSTMGKKVIVFSDLIKSSFGSNNKSVNNYLNNIDVGSKLYESIKTGKIQYDELDENQKNELIIFSKHLATLYNNTMKGKKESEIFVLTDNTLDDIFQLSKKISPDGNLDYNLADRIVRMFCGFSGIDTLEQAKEYVRQKVENADARNRNASNSKMVLEQGDFIKGIGSIVYLRNILQNGSVSKEYLGSSATSDGTPLDTDVSMITSSEGTTSDRIAATAANNYGPIWFVLKNDERFITTRTNTESLDAKRDTSKMEVFFTGVLGEGHYGIRTGFASSEINYIVMDKYDPRVGLEIAMNGFYIPIANKEGEIVFTPTDYDNLREKMSGLSYYGENNYTFSNNLITKETQYLASQLEQSNYEIEAKRTKINEVIRESLDELGLHLKTNIDGDLTEGYVELIDTGSTGRGTNKPGDGDFDFMMRLDKTLLSNPSKHQELKQTLLKKLGKENSSELTGTGDFRLKNVPLDEDTNIDVDITFTEKTDKISYSTDMALQDRLSTIQKTDPEKYKYVVANILLAKQVLKQAEVYKPDRGEIQQGGLGGVGIENWILQNGGSFLDAATSFVEAAEGKSFKEFKSTYQIWDFGDNHLAERKGQYPHDNFVENNMSEKGYNKMVEVLKAYTKNVQLTDNNAIYR